MHIRHGRDESIPVATWVLIATTAEQSINRMSDVTSIVEPPEAATGTYDRILASSAWIGGSSVLNIFIGTIRTKLMALMLGPAGFGLFGIYASLANLAQCLAGMGIYSSGVRQIAHAASSAESERISRTSTVLRRTCYLLGVLGTAILVIFSRPISRVTFGTGQHAAAIVLLSVAVFFHLLSDGQTALIQGMQQIQNLAKLTVLSALFGTVISISLIYFLRERGVVPSLVGVALATLSVSWWYGRKIRVPSVAMTVSQVAQETSDLLKLGFAFMTSGLASIGSAYAVRMILLRDIGPAATGYYQAAWTLGVLYVGFILESMGADFYPRLTAHAEDNAACNRLVNEQTQVGLLIAGPGVLATLTLAPLVIFLFYSSKFGQAVGILRWIALGTILQVVTWPMSYMIVAKGRHVIYLFSELSWGVFSIPLAWLCVRHSGASGAGMAFFGANVLYGILLLPITRRLSGFQWSAANRRTALLFFLFIAAAFCGFCVLPFAWATFVGATSTVVSTIYSIRTIVRLVSWDSIPHPARRLLIALRLAPTSGLSQLEGAL